MKIVTLGLSPYLCLSNSKIHSLILKNLYFSKKHEVACIALGHDTSYFLPKKDLNGDDRFYFSFDNHDIPLIPLNKKEMSIALYEVLKIFKPDILLTIGDFNDYLYMKAVKMFLDYPIKWLSILSNFSYPINEKNIEILEEMDAIVCTNKKTYDLIKKDQNKSLSYINCRTFNVTPEKSQKLSITTCGRNSLGDNLPMLMQVCSELKSDLSLYIHTNIYNTGDYDLVLVKERFDPKDEFIRFPEKYISLEDAYSDAEYSEILAKSNIFVNISTSSATGISVFDAISCGCLPLMSDVGCHRDIAEMITEISSEFVKEDFLVPTIELMISGEVYINICRPDLLKEKIINLQNKIKKGYKPFYQEFQERHNRKSFVKEVMRMIEVVKTVNSTITVDTV